MSSLLPCWPGRKEKEQVGKLPDMIPGLPHQNTVVSLLCRCASHMAPLHQEMLGWAVRLEWSVPLVDRSQGATSSQPYGMLRTDVLRADEPLPGASPCHPTRV